MRAEQTAPLVQRYGERITLRRITGTTQQVTLEVQPKAKVRFYKTTEIAGIGMLAQGDREVIISNAEIAAAQWPGPPKKLDEVVIAGKTSVVQGAVTRTLAGVPALHVLQVRGN